MSVIYVIVWRYSDGSASGAVSAHQTQANAEAMLSILEAQESSRRYAIETIPSEAAP